MLRDPKTRYIATGAGAFVLFGLTLIIIGTRFIVYQYLFSMHGQKVVGEVTATGTVHNSSGVNVDYIRYGFKDSSGKSHTGQSSGYSGVVGESVLLEYVPPYSFVHRVAGEGKGASYRWRWAIFFSGCLFCTAGFHWLIATLRRIKLGEHLSKKGLVTVGKVMKISDGGRTIVYEYHIQSRTFNGKSMALPAAIVKQFKPGDTVDLYVDPQSLHKSVMKVEI